MREPGADEISLRDLYLTLRQGLPIIVIVAVLAGGLGLLYQLTRPTQYESTGTTLLTVPPFEVDNARGFNIRPDAVVNFETYETLALSSAVLEATLQASGLSTLDVITLRRQLSLEPLLEPDAREQNTTLSVTHRVRSNDPASSSALAQAWVEATLATVQASLLEDLAPIDASTSAELETLQHRLEQAEAALEAFRASDDGTTLNRQLGQLEAVLVDSEIRLGNLAIREQVLSARTATLEQQLAEAAATIGRLDPSDGDLFAGQQLSTVLALTERQAAAARALRSTTEGALDDFDKRNDLTLLRERLGSLRQTLTERERRLASIDSDIAATSALRNDLERQLAEQPQTLRLNDVVIGTIVPASFELQGVEFTRETLNPNHTGITNHLSAAEADLASLQVRKTSLEGEIATLLPQVEALDDRLIDLQRERGQLVERHQLELAADAILTERLASLQFARSSLAGSDPAIRATAPEVQQLENQLRSGTLDLQEVLSERDALLTRQQSYEQRIVELRERIAGLDRQRSVLERTTANARSAYQDISSMQPVISYLARVLPSGVRVLSPAITPEMPVAKQSGLQTLMAAVLGATLALLFVFLRAAVAPVERKDGDEIASARAPRGNPQATSETMA